MLTTLIRPLELEMCSITQSNAGATSGPEHDPVHPSAGPANPEGPSVRGEDGSPAPWPRDQVQAGGGESQAEHRQAIQGTKSDLEPLTQPPFCLSLWHIIYSLPICCLCVLTVVKCSSYCMQSQKG